MRLFIAIELDPPIRRAAYELALELRESVAGRAVREDHMHLTLAFLGEQPGGRLGALRKCMERAAAGSFGLELGNVGRFRRSGGDIWWLGVRLSPELRGLQARLCSELRSAGFETEERPFRPHITLLRQAGGDAPRTPDFPPLEQRVERMTLFESLRERGALVYRPLARVELGRL